MMFHLCQCIQGILLRGKPRSCCLVQLPALKKIREIILLWGGVLWSPLQGPAWAGSECRYPSIYKWDFPPAGEQYQLLCGWGLSAGFVCICVSQGRDSSLGWCLLAVDFKSLYIVFIDWILEVSVVISMIDVLQAYKKVYFTFCRLNITHVWF